MKLGVTIIIGLLIGILDGVGIMFDPDERYKIRVHSHLLSHWICSLIPTELMGSDDTNKIIVTIQEPPQKEIASR